MTILEPRAGEEKLGRAGDGSDRGHLQVNVVSPNVDIRQRVAAIWRYRELLVGMTRKELRVQYKDSVLGFLWSLLNPATTLIVYYVVFQIILKSGIPYFAIYLISGNIVWNFFSSSVAAACGSVVGNASIIKKVAFPREIPALAVVGSSLMQMGFQSIVMVLFLVGFWRGPAVAYLPLLIPALLAIIVLAAALGILFAAINVRMRDMSHLLGVALQVWFWACPIVYQYRLVRDRVLLNHSAFVHALFILYRLNPVTPIVLTFQRAIYGVTSPYSSTVKHNVAILPDHAGLWWYLWQDLAVLGFALALMVVALRVFARAEGNFAEEL
jgi:ABC-2 type transport system permease protein